MTQTGHSGETTSDTANIPGTAVTVNTSSTAILWNNPNRLYAAVFNVSTSNWIYLTYGTAGAAASSGIPLSPGGGGIEINDYTGQVNAIASGTASTVTLVEV